MSDKEKMIETIKEELGNASPEVLRFVYAYILYFKRNGSA